MYICENCFNSEPISKYISEFGDSLKADFICNSCNNRSTYRLDKDEFKSKIQSIIKKHFVHDSSHGLISSAASYAKAEKDDISTYISPKIIYTLREVCNELFKIDYEPLFYDLLSDSTNYEYRNFDSDFSSDSDFEDLDLDVWINMGRDWYYSSIIDLKWNEFCERIKNEALCGADRGFDKIEELSKLETTFFTLSSTVPLTLLYRARSAKKEETLKEINSNPAKQLGIAPAEKAKHNRFSPEGVPYVYLSADNETIIKEIRATNEDRVAIGKFTIENLNLIDLRKEHIDSISKDIFDDRCSAQLLCSAKTILEFLADITKEVKREDSHSEYIPTQLVSEYIRSLEFDGFIFDSSICSGTNYVLFKDDYTFLEYHIQVNMDI